MGGADSTRISGGSAGKAGIVITVSHVLVLGHSKSDCISVEHVSNISSPM